MHHKFLLPIFDVEIEIYVGEKTFKKFKKESSKRGYDIKAGGYSGYSAGSLIWLKRLDFLILTHEISHATNNILNYIGVNDEETRAYTLEYIMKKSTKKFFKIKEK